MTLARWIFALGLSLALGGCDDEGGEPVLAARVLVGDVEGTDIDLAMLVDGDDLAVYACGGAQTVATESRWYRGTIGDGDDPNAFELRADGRRLVGVRTAGGIEGELVREDGTTAPLSMTAVDDDADAGLYLGSHDGHDTGVVVQGEGDEATAQGSSCVERANCTQVIILPPLRLADGALAVQVQTDDSVLEATVTRTLVAPAGV